MSAFRRQLARGLRLVGVSVGRYPVRRKRAVAWNPRLEEGGGESIGRSWEKISSCSRNSTGTFLSFLGGLFEEDGNYLDANV